MLMVIIGERKVTVNHSSDDTCASGNVLSVKEDNINGGSPKLLKSEFERKGRKKKI